MMTVDIHSSTPSPVTANVSAQFSPPAGSLLALTWGSTLYRQVVSITDNLGEHLSWTRLKTQSTFADIRNEVWLADCLSAQTNMTVTVTPDTGTPSLFGILVLVNAAPVSGQLTATDTPIGKFAAQNGASGSPTASLSSPTTVGSLPIASIGDRAGAAPSVPGDQTTTFGGKNFQPNNNAWLQGLTAINSAGGGITISDTVASAEWGELLVEILPAAAPSNVTSMNFVVSP